MVMDVCPDQKHVIITMYHSICYCFSFNKLLKYDLLNKHNSPSSVPSVMKLPIKTQKKMAMMFPGCHSFPVEGLIEPL